MPPRDAAWVVAVALLLAGGCWSEQSRRPGAPAAPAAAPIASCALDPPARTPLDVSLIGWLGWAGDRTWIHLRRGATAVVAALGPDGALVELPVSGSPEATYVDGTRLWIAQGRAKPGLDLIRVDLAGARPTVAQRASLSLTPLAGIASFAVGGSRVLVEDLDADIRLQLYDLERGVRLGATAVIASRDLGGSVLRCRGDRCFALGVEGDGPSRRLFIERFAPDGAHEHEPLAGDHLAMYRLAAHGAGWLVVWTSFNEPGLFARELDAAGRPLTPRTKIYAGEGTDFEIVPDPRRLQIAVRTGGGWALGAVAARAPRPILAAPTGMPKEAYFLTGARAAEGTLLVGFSSRVDYQGGYHTWSGSAHAVFVRDGDGPEAVVPIASASGDGRGGIGAFPLIAPGYAAVLVVQRGPEAAAGGELIVLRRPCPTAAGGAPR